MSGAGLAERWDTVRGLRMRTLVIGDPEAPVVVLVHGLGLAGTSMADMARHLAPDHRVLIPDLPGFGESEHPPRALSIRGLADALDRWCEALGVADAVVVGNSYGAQVVAELAAREVEEGRTERRVRAIVLIGPTCDPGARSLTGQIRRWAANSGGDEGGGNPLDLVGPYLKAGLLRTARTARSATRHRIEDRLPVVDVPVLILAGDIDKISPLSWTERLTRLAQQGELRIVEGGAHSMHGSHPERLAHLVRLFVRDRLGESTAVASGAGGPGGVQRIYH
jgi:pimeloyl-ACP methyl ester carboxylesterase